MDGFMQCALLATILGYFLVSPVNAQNGQSVNTPCTASMIATFTPCMNYVTGSSANGSSSPSSNCCDAFKSVLSNSMDCACLLVTAGIPLPLVNRTLALGLPRICKGAGVPVQCQATGSPLPPPGPLQFGAPPPISASSPQGPLQFGAPSPSSAFSPHASKASTAATPAPDQPKSLDVSPAPAPTVAVQTPSSTPGIRPILTPSSSSSPMISVPTVWLILMGYIVLKL